MEFNINEYVGEGGVLTLTCIQRKMEFNTNEYRKVELNTNEYREEGGV